MTLVISERHTARFDRLASCCLLICGFLFSLAGPVSAQAQIKTEYFVQQNADEALLIRVNAFEAEIESNVYAPEHRLVLSSSMPHSRLVPVFQFIDASEKPRQLDIEVSSGLSTANSKFEIEFTRVSSWDKRSAALERAYRLLSFGMQLSKTDNAADWTVKINSLMTASSVFGQYGMQELRLWSAYLVAHLVQYRLHDYNMVLGLTREILAGTSGTRWQEIELAALQLRSAALIGLRQSGDLQVPASGPDPVQTALLETADRAKSLAYHFEQAQAINQSAQEYERQSLYPQALEQFQLALEIADLIGDNALAQALRENIAQIHAGQGNDPATSKVLQEIETQLAEDGGGDELALNLLQQGRILIANYRYPQAADVLLQALSFENDSSIRSRINLELAKTQYETGQKQAMLKYLAAAGIPSQQAQSYFQQSFKAAMAGPGGLRHEVESRYLRARSLARNGQRKAALDVLEQLIDQVLFLRQSLPGVLGAWFWERNVSLLEEYLALQVAGGEQTLLALSKIRYATKTSVLDSDTDALRTQLAQRESAGGGGRSNAGIEQQLKLLRRQFDARFEFLSKSGLRKYLAGLGADEAVLTYHLGGSKAWAWVAVKGKVQQRKLANPAKIYAALKDAVKRYPLGSGTGSGMGSGMGSGAIFDRWMDDLGKQLLGPVSDLLPETVYVIPSGQLLGIPFDALRLNKRYMVEQHTVVNLLAFPSNPNPSASLKFSKPNKIFIAGDPQSFSGGYTTRLESSAGIQAVTNIFVGPGLYIIQGAALLADEFQAEHFLQADLVHLTMPGIINLANAEHSGIQLSEPVRDMGRATLAPVDIRQNQADTRLVYLGAAEVRGSSRSDASYQLGIVSDFLLAGSDSVIAGLWVVQDNSAENFLVDFYQGLESTGNIAAALTGTKRALLQQRNSAGSHDWAALQLFID